MKKGSNPPPPKGAKKPAPPPAPPGRGGPRTAGPGKKMGAPRKEPGERTVVKGPYRFPPDVAEILGKQRNATKFICDAIRGGGEVEARIAYCRCGTDYIVLTGRDVCPNGCEAGSATLGALMIVEV